MIIHDTTYMICSDCNDMLLLNNIVSLYIILIISMMTIFNYYLLMI